MNPKIKKLISILILLIVIVSSLTYYENSTEPQGLQGICNGIYAENYSYAHKLPEYGWVGYLHSDNVSYLGNKVDIMMWIFSLGDIFNLS